MANSDRPNGFRPVKSLNGMPVSMMVRAIGVADGEDIFIGDALNLESGLADPADTNDSALLGVAVGFAKKDTMSQEAIGGNFNAADLSQRFYDDSANTHSDWVVYYVPFKDMVFEVQTATALTKLPGETVDLESTAGSETTGISAHEITTSSNADFVVVEVPKYPDNDATAVWGRYWVRAVQAEQSAVTL